MIMAKFLSFDQFFSCLGKTIFQNIIKLNGAQEKSFQDQWTFYNKMVIIFRSGSSQPNEMKNLQS